MPVVRGRLRPEDEKRIRSNFVLLKSEIEATDLVDYLYQEQVLELCKCEEIRESKTRGDRAEILLLAILHSGPGKSYNHFISILKKKYSHLAAKLEATPTEDCDPKSYYSWFESIAETKKKHKITQADTYKLFECFDHDWPNIFHQLGFSSGEIEQEYIRHQHDSRAEMMSLFMKGNKLKEIQDDKGFTLENIVEALKKVEDARVCFIKWDAVNEFVNEIQ